MSAGSPISYRFRATAFAPLGANIGHTSSRINGPASIPKRKTEMTHAQQTHPGTSSVLPAAAAAFVLAAALAMAMLLGQVSIPSFGAGGTAGQNQAAIESGRAWQLQREQQAGIGVISDAVRNSASDWEGQRKAQSGAGSTTRETGPTDPKIR